MARPIIHFYIPVMLDGDADNEREHNENDEALFAGRKNKYGEQPLHPFV